MDAKKGKEDKPEPEANFALSGKLAAESNTVNGVVLLHQEPPESRKPFQMWRLYGFKNGQCLHPPPCPRPCCLCHRAPPNFSRPDSCPLVFVHVCSRSPPVTSAFCDVSLLPLDCTMIAFWGLPVPPAFFAAPSGSLTACARMGSRQAPLPIQVCLLCLVTLSYFPRHSCCTQLSNICAV